MDLFHLTVDRFNEFQDREVFLPLLYEKGRLVCGYFSAWIADTGAVLADAPETYRKILKNFSIDLSSGIQLANDAGDFIPSYFRVKTPDKSYKDQFTDIGNGRLTLCTWYCIKYGNPQQKKELLNLVGKKKANSEELERAIYALRDSGAFNFVLGEAARIMSRCKGHLTQLPASAERDLLSTMASLVRTNKFYSFLRENYGVK